MLSLYTKLANIAEKNTENLINGGHTVFNKLDTQCG